MKMNNEKLKIKLNNYNIQKFIIIYIYEDSVKTPTKKFEVIAEKDAILKDALETKSSG